MNGKPDSEFYKKAARDLLPVVRESAAARTSSPVEAGIVPLALDGELYHAQREYLSGIRLVRRVFSRACTTRAWSTRRT